MKQKQTQAWKFVKCIALLHSIITDVDGLHDSSSDYCGKLDTNDGTQFI